MAQLVASRRSGVVRDQPRHPVRPAPPGHAGRRPATPCAPSSGANPGRSPLSCATTPMPSRGCRDDRPAGHDRRCGPATPATTRRARPGTATRAWPPPPSSWRRAAQDVQAAVRLARSRGPGRRGAGDRARHRRPRVPTACSSTPRAMRGCRGRPGRPHRAGRRRSPVGRRDPRCRGSRPRRPARLQLAASASSATRWAAASAGWAAGTAWRRARCASAEVVTADGGARAGRYRRREPRPLLGAARAAGATSASSPRWSSASTRSRTCTRATSSTRSSGRATCSSSGRSGAATLPDAMTSAVAFRRFPPLPHDPGGLPGPPLRRPCAAAGAGRTSTDGARLVAAARAGARSDPEIDTWQAMPACPSSTWSAWTPSTRSPPSQHSELLRDLSAATIDTLGRPRLRLAA